MTAHDHATGTSWAVIDRPYNSDASRLFLSISAHSKFLEIRRSAIAGQVCSRAAFSPGLNKLGTQVIAAMDGLRGAMEGRLGNAIVERVAFDRSAAGIADELLDLSPRQAETCGSAGAVDDTLFNDG